MDINVHLNFIPAAPFNLLSRILHLLLSSSQLSSHLVNLLFQQTACIQLLCVRRTGSSSMHRHNFPPAIDVYLLYCRAVSSLSCCLLVSSAAIWSTFWSVILYGAQMGIKRHAWRSQDIDDIVSHIYRHAAIYCQHLLYVYQNLPHYYTYRYLCEWGVKPCILSWPIYIKQHMWLPLSLSQDVHTS